MDGFYDFIHILTFNTEWKGIYIPECFKQNAFALHHRHSRLRSYVAEPEYGCSVRNHQAHVPSSGQIKRFFHILLNFQTGLRHAGCVRQ